MAELIDWVHHESVTKAEPATGYARQDHHLPHGSLEPHITNADRIRAMTDEELAEWMEELDAFSLSLCNVHLAEDVRRDNKETYLLWLKKEVEDG